MLAYNDFKFIHFENRAAYDGGQISDKVKIIELKPR